MPPRPSAPASSPRVVPAAELLDEALKTADKIAEFSLPAVMMAKESVNRAYETTLAEGLRFERRLFHSMFATRRPEGGHGGLRREAGAAIQERVDAHAPASLTPGGAASISRRS